MVIILMAAQKAVNMLFHILCERMESLQSDNSSVQFCTQCLLQKCSFILCFSTLTAGDELMPRYANKR